MRAERGHAGVAAVLQREQAREHAARRAAAAADALPPTLRSIAQGRAALTGGGGGGEGGGGEHGGDTECALVVGTPGDPLPSSPAALRGGRGRMQVVVRWAAWRGLDAALSDGVFDAARAGRAAGQTHLVDVRTGTSLAVARGGARWPAWAPDASCLPTALRSGCVIPRHRLTAGEGGDDVRWPLISVHVPGELRLAAASSVAGASSASSAAISIPVAVLLVCYNPFPSGTPPLSFDVTAPAAAAVAAGADASHALVESGGAALQPGGHAALLAWEGVRCHRVRGLQPGQLMTVRLSARVSLPEGGSGALPSGSRANNSVANVNTTSHVGGSAAAVHDEVARRLLLDVCDRVLVEWVAEGASSSSGGGNEGGMDGAGAGIVRFVKTLRVAS